MKNTLLPMVLWLAFAAYGHSQTYTSGEWSYTLNSSSEATITAYTGEGGEVAFPAIIDGFSVKSIGSQVFGFGNASVTGVVVPSGVVAIQNSAFSGCRALVAVAISESVGEIGSHAFSDCNSLLAISVAEGNSAFSSADGVLFDASGQTLLVYPKAKTGHYDVPNGVTVISESAFAFSKITGVAFPEGLASIDGFAFQNCRDLAGNVEIPLSLGSIGYGAFGYCPLLTSFSVDLAHPVYSSREGVLFSKDQTALLAFPGGKTGSYDIPEGVVRIEDAAFAGSSNLTEVNLPASLVTLENPPFVNVGSITAINVDPANPLYESESGVLYEKTKQVLVRYPAGASATSFTVPQAVTTLKEQAFGGAAGLTNLVIPNSVTNIAGGAFAGSGLVHVDLPAGLTVLEMFLFAECFDLRTVSIPAGVTAIKDLAFLDCRALESIEIPGSCTSIGGYAFAGCSSLTSATVGSGVSDIYDGAFSTGGSLRAVVFLGNAPTLLAWSEQTVDIFRVSSPTVYYLPSTSGWTETLSGRPARPLTAQSLMAEGADQVASSPGDFGLFTQAEFDANRTSGQSDVTGNPALFGLFTHSQLDDNRVAGQQDVVANPMSYGLYDSSSIMDLRMNGLMVQKQGSNAVVTFQPQTTTDLTLPFTNNGTPITNSIPLPGNKGFIRINAKPNPTPVVN